MCNRYQSVFKLFFCLLRILGGLTHAWVVVCDITEADVPVMRTGWIVENCGRSLYQRRR